MNQQSRYGGFHKCVSDTIGKNQPLFFRAGRIKTLEKCTQCIMKQDQKFSARIGQPKLRIRIYLQMLYLMLLPSNSDS